MSRFLPEYAQNPAGIKMLGTVSVLLRGIPFIYQGQEIGMQNAEWNSIDEYDDISTKDQYKAALAAGLSEEQALAACGRMSRDNARTPMQWSDEANAGFTTAKPWLKVNEGSCSPTADVFRHMRIQMASWLITERMQINVCWLRQILAGKKHRSGWMAV